MKCTSVNIDKHARNTVSIEVGVTGVSTLTMRFRVLAFGIRFLSWITGIKLFINPEWDQS
jgi:hypothetical protein